MNIVSMIRHRDKAPTNALIAHGSASLCRPRNPLSCLLEVRLREASSATAQRLQGNNGFKRIDLPRYYVPLSLFGRAAFRLGLHHRFYDRVPESVATKFRELRAAWTDRKLRP